MVHRVAYDPASGIVFSEFEGVVLPDEVMAKVRRCLAVAAEHDAIRFLTDCSRAELRLSGFDIIRAAEALESRVDTDRFNLALVLPDDERQQQTLFFFETVFMNRGGTVEVFATRSDATAWLEDVGSHNRRASQQGNR